MKNAQHYISSNLKKITFRRKCRILAIQFLYMIEKNLSNSYSRQNLIKNFFLQINKKRIFYNFTEKLINGVFQFQSIIDRLIKQYIINWEFSRISKIDLAILRLSIFEILYCKNIPKIVIINEAIELTKHLSNLDSKRFINGILDTIRINYKL